MDNSLVVKQNELKSNVESALGLIDDIVLKNYMLELSDMEVIPLSDSIKESNIANNIRLFKINEMVYHKDESSSHKLTSVFSAAAATESSVFMIIDSNGSKTDFYMGIRSMNPENSTKTCYDTMLNSMKGQFPGVKTQNLFEDEIKELIGKVKPCSISAVSSVANSKSKEQVENSAFIQGLEKLALAMQGKKYTGVILASPSSQYQILDIKKRYEDIYTNISSYSNLQITYGNNRSKNTSDAYTKTESSGRTSTRNTSETSSRGSTTSESNSYSKSKDTAGATASKALGVASAAIGTVIAPGLGTIIGGGVGLVLGSVLGGNESNSESTSRSTTENYSETSGESFGTTETLTEGTTKTEGLAMGSSEGLQMTVQNKMIINFLDRIDKQLERISEFESLGGWECSAYFMSEDNSTSNIAASTYKAIVQGENTGVEVSAINTWDGRSQNSMTRVRDYITNFMHPTFRYRKNNIDIPVSSANLVSGNELSIHMALPRKSVTGFPVIEHVDFGKEVVMYSESDGSKINLGNIFNMGMETETRAYVDIQSLAMHTFISGSTGAGKSNTVYEILDQLDMHGIKFLIIEPVKGEYKHIFGSRSDVNVFGTNPLLDRILRINPFKFQKGIHVLEHIDRLVEIFNVCWPMYAAMPAILKEALIESYEASGWDLLSSENRFSEELFPTFKDLLLSLESVIGNSSYSEELKSNYSGALITRVKSLTNGINERLFSADDIEDEVLFDQNAIVDLSRIGSQETKALIMGILVMKLSEYRSATSQEMNTSLKHVTVLEEAHNLLRRTSMEQSAEGSNLMGKSVEMLSNAIAEMRTYGEGFIIADQSPNAVDISAIRNTNTKIIMRLPDEADRVLVGKSAALKQEQLDEISKLPKGVAVVYQNDWLEPVLCKINKFYGEQKRHRVDPEDLKFEQSESEINSKVVNFLLKNRVSENLEVDIDRLEASVFNANIPARNKIMLKGLLEEYRDRQELEIWDSGEFTRLSKLVTNFLGANKVTDRAIMTSKDHKELTDNLRDYLNKRIDGLDSDLELAIMQCLLKNSSVEKAENLDIYSAWITEVRKGMMI